MPKRHTEQIMHSSREAAWRTPTSLFAKLDQEFHFLLDAAASKENKFCGNYFGPDHFDPKQRNALQVDWAAYVENSWQVQNVLTKVGVFVNPPYSKELSGAYTSGKIKVGGVEQEHPKDLALAAGFRVGSWCKKAWEESQKGLTVVGVIPYSPQTDWWRKWVEGMEPEGGLLANFHAAREVRKIPHRVSFLRPDGTEEGNAGGNTAIVVWKGRHGLCAPWVPFSAYWDFL